MTSKKKLKLLILLYYLLILFIRLFILLIYLFSKIDIFINANWDILSIKFDNLKNYLIIKLEIGLNTRFDSFKDLNNNGIN